MSQGRLEGLVTIPSGGWTVSLTGSSSGDSTVGAGEYYMSSPGDGSNSLLDELASQWSTTTGDTITASISGGADGTGKVTLSSDGGTFEVTWDSGDGNTDLRDALGFADDGDLSGATSYTSSRAARSVWVPAAHYQVLNSGNNWDGVIRSNFRSMVNMAGYSYALAGQRRKEKNIVWPAVAQARTWVTDESVTDQSYERFYIDTVLGEAAWANRPGGPVRFYEDASNDNQYRTYVYVDATDFAPSAFRAHYVGLWQVATGTLVEHPGGGSATTTSSTHSLKVVKSSNQYAEITDAQQTGLDPAGDFTLEGCFQFDSLPTGGGIYTVACKGSGTSGMAYCIDVEESGGSYKIRFYFARASDSNVYVLGWTVSLSTDTPYYAGLGYDSSAQVNQTTLVFGEVGSVSDQGSPTMISGTGTDTGGAVTDNAQPFRLGSRKSVSSRDFDGWLDEWRFWDTLRTVAERANNHNTQLNAGSQSNLQGYWRLNTDNSGTTPDQTTNMNDLTLTNGASIVSEPLF